MSEPSFQLSGHRPTGSPSVSSTSFCWKSYGRNNQKRTKALFVSSELCQPRNPWRPFEFTVCAPGYRDLFFCTFSSFSPFKRCSRIFLCIVWSHVEDDALSRQETVLLILTPVTLFPPRKTQHTWHWGKVLRQKRPNFLRTSFIKHELFACNYYHCSGAASLIEFQIHLEPRGCCEQHWGKLESKQRSVIMFCN